MSETTQPEHLLVERREHVLVLRCTCCPWRVRTQHRLASAG